MYNKYLTSPVSLGEYTIETFSFKLGEKRFNGDHWLDAEGRLTKSPPSEGTCRVFLKNSLIFQGDWMKLPQSFREDLRV